MAEFDETTINDEPIQEVVIEAVDAAIEADAQVEAEPAAAEEAPADESCDTCEATDETCDTCEEASEPSEAEQAAEAAVDDAVESAKEFADKTAEAAVRYATFALEQVGALVNEIGRAFSSLATPPETKEAPAAEYEPVAEDADEAPAPKEETEIDKLAAKLRAYKALVDEGLINEDDYEAKKRQLLGL